MAYIHDECLMAVDTDVNPKFVYKLIYENCMKEVKGYPRFYCGINVINNWYEGKDDKYEAPVGYVEECIATNPPVFINPSVDHKQMALEGITEYMIRRIKTELFNIDTRTANGYFDLPKLVPAFKNYFVKPKIAAYIGLHRKVNEDTQYDDFAVASLESFALHQFKKSIVIDMEGTTRELIRNTETYIPNKIYVYEDKDIDTNELHEWAQSQSEGGDDAWLDDAEAESVGVFYMPPEVLEKFTSEYITETSTGIGWGFKS